jgi:1-deoxy-D-xylulose-5-phosphate reductoisomerase
MKRLALLGSTGSIGRQTLDVVRWHPDEFSVSALVASRPSEVFAAQVAEFKPRVACATSADGAEPLMALATDPEIDLLVVATSGTVGFRPTIAALAAGKPVALANKETLIMAGHLVTEAAALTGAPLLPIDSEHSAIFQAIQGSPGRDALELIVLTGSGGPFRGKSRAELANVSVEDALKHPTWRMGKKITIDSATLMNKALEVIEARWLFDLDPEQIEVIVHPESVVHSFVEFVDGSVLAQLSPPDMRLPIQYALTYPERLSGPARRLDWRELSAFHFEPPDHETFPSLQLGYDVARRGGTCGAVLNAANEAAVGRFLAGELRFLDIPRVCRAVLSHHDFSAAPSLEELGAADRWARHEVLRWISAKHPNPTLT